MYMSDRLLFVKRNSKLAYLRTHCQLLSLCSVGNERMCVGHWWNDTDRGNPDLLGEKSVPVPFRPPHMPYGLAWDWTLASIVIDGRVRSMYSLALLKNQLAGDLH
jgi:hypothetical protein